MADCRPAFLDWCILHGSPLPETNGALNARNGVSAITSIRKQFVSILGITITEIVGIVSDNPDVYRPSNGFR